MKFKLFLFLPALMVYVYLSAQVSEIKRERLYTGESLYGFMNGAADLYFEYGFKSLVDRDIIYKGEDFTVDIYEMPTREDAYGIYSINVYRCQHADSMEYINCFSPYQLQAVVDNFYISIVFPSGSAQAQQTAYELIPLYISVEQSSIPDIPEEIATSPPFSGIVKYLKGPISVFNSSRDLTMLLKNVAYRGVWLSANQQTKTYKAIIIFSSSEEKEKFRQTIPVTDILRFDGDALFIQRKELENEPSKAGEFGF